jgi:hypothetical protein
MVTYSVSIRHSDNRHEYSCTHHCRNGSGLRRPADSVVSRASVVCSLLEVVFYSPATVRFHEGEMGRHPCVARYPPPRQALQKHQPQGVPAATEDRRSRRSVSPVCSRRHYRNQAVHAVDGTSRAQLNDELTVRRQQRVALNSATEIGGEAAAPRTQRLSWYFVTCAVKDCRVPPRPASNRSASVGAPTARK